MTREPASSQSVQVKRRAVSSDNREFGSCCGGASNILTRSHFKSGTPCVLVVSMVGSRIQFLCEHIDLATLSSQCASFSIRCLHNDLIRDLRTCLSGMIATILYRSHKLVALNRCDKLAANNACIQWESRNEAMSFVASAHLLEPYQIHQFMYSRNEPHNQHASKARITEVLVNTTN